MRAASLIVSFACVVCLCAILPAAAPAEEGKDAAPAGMQPAAPGPEHALLAKQAGTWKATQKLMMDPTKPPQVSAATEVCTLICNGLFLRSDYHMKDAQGEMHGSGLLGYDTAKKKYVGVWVDTYGTAIYPYEGTCAGDKCTYTLDTTDPSGKPVTLTMVYEIVDDDHRKFAMMMPGADGKPMTTMEIDYTRQ